jgi:hypothetical protein
LVRPEGLDWVYRGHVVALVVWYPAVRIVEFRLAISGNARGPGSAGAAKADRPGSLEVTLI